MTAPGAVSANFAVLENLTARIIQINTQLESLQNTWNSFATGEMAVALADASGDEFQMVQGRLRALEADIRAFLDMLAKAVQQAKEEFQRTVAASKSTIGAVGS